MAEPSGREENSGLIDLDALLAEAASSPGVGAAEEPEPAPPPPPRSSPRRRAHAATAVLAVSCAVLVAGIAWRSSSGAPAAIPPATAAERGRPAPAGISTSGTTEPRGIDAHELAEPQPEPRAPSPSTRRAPLAVAPASAAVETSEVVTAAGIASGDLGSAMKDAVGPRGAASIEAARTEGPASARQIRPSPGAVTSAIQTALPSARACLAPDDPVRAATVVFRSDGAVERVDFTSRHATDACVRAALSRARTGPFSDPTYAARTIVRPRAAR